MAMTGGRYPFDQAGALAGPARTVIADPATVALPTVSTDIVASVADAQGEYQLETGWRDFGLSADTPSYSHDKDTEGLEYQQPASNLFEAVSEIERQFVAQVAHIDMDNIKVIENTNLTSTVAATAPAAPAPAAAQDIVYFGLYNRMIEHRVALISYRPDGAAVVTEPAGSPVGTRPPFVILVCNRVTLAAEESEMTWERGEPVNAEVTFSLRPEQGLASGKEHGFWIIEQPGVIAA